MQTPPAALSLAPAPAFVPNRRDAAGEMAGSFETTLDALGASCTALREDEGLADSGLPPDGEEEALDGETESASPWVEPLATLGQPPVGAATGLRAAAGVARTGKEGLPGGLSIENGDAPPALQGATSQGPPAGQGAQSGSVEIPSSAGINPQAKAPDLLRNGSPTTAALPMQTSPVERRAGCVAPDDAGEAKGSPELAPSCHTPEAQTPALAQDATRAALPASAPAAPEPGQPADLPAGTLLLQVGLRDAPPAVPEAPTLHRPFVAEPHRQIADAIVRSRDGQVEVILNPVELGRVTVLLGAEGNPGHLALFVERPETLDLIRRHSDQLLRDLRDGGMPDPSLDLLQQDSQGHPRDRGQQLEGWPATRDRAPDSLREPAPRVVSLSRLDIRL